jgi:hypothetical protein
MTACDDSDRADLEAAAAVQRKLEQLLSEPSAEQVASLVAAGVRWEPDQNLRVAPANPDELRDAILGEFGPDVAERSAYFVRSDDRLELVPGLRTPGAPVILMRSTPERACHAAIAEGWVAWWMSPLVASVQDFTTCSRLETWSGALIVTPTVLEAAAWRLMGLAAAPVGSMARLHPQFQRQTAEWVRMRVTRPNREEVLTKKKRLASLREKKQASPADVAKIRRLTGELRLDVVLIVPAWDPLTFAARDREETLPHVQALLRVERLAPCDFGGVGVWSPPAPVLAAVQRALTAGDHETSQAELRRSLAMHVTLADAFERKVSVTQPADFTQARSALAAASMETALEARSAEAAYRTLAEEQLVLPFVKAAQACTDPYERALHMSAAQVMSRVSDLETAQLRESATPRRWDEGKIKRLEEQRLLRAEFLKIIDAIDGRRHARRHKNSRG